MDVPINEARRRPADALEYSRSARAMRRIIEFPWWFLWIVLLGVFVVVLIATDVQYGGIFAQLRKGIVMTLRVSVTAYALSLVFGLLIGIVRGVRPQLRYGTIGRLVSLIQTLVYNLAQFYVQLLRGLPILVTLLIVAFVLVPALNGFLQATFGFRLPLRSSTPETAVFALTLTYAAFLSETFRAGIESINRGQIEAARSLGMTYFQIMRYIVLPQAIRRILPPLGNDLIAMVKDSSLVAFLGIEDITQMAKLYSSATFRYFETYLIAGAIYVFMTFIGSLGVRYIERRFPVER